MDNRTVDRDSKNGKKTMKIEKDIVVDRDLKKKNFFFFRWW
jgi:hypothetical protein